MTPEFGNAESRVIMERYDKVIFGN